MALFIKDHPSRMCIAALEKCSYTEFKIIAPIVILVADPDRTQQFIYIGLSAKLNNHMLTLFFCHQRDWAHANETKMCVG